MTMRTLEELQAELTQVRAAISAAYSGQEYEIQTGGIQRRLKRQSLDALIKREQELERIIERASGRSAVSFGMPV